MSYVPFDLHAVIFPFNHFPLPLKSASTLSPTFKFFVAALVVAFPAILALNFIIPPGFSRDLKIL